MVAALLIAMAWIAKRFLLEGGDPMPPRPGAPINAPASKPDFKSAAADAALQVRAQDIGKKVRIIGRLGKPMGERLKVKGEWREPSEVTKPNGLHFLVTHVDGTELAEPVEFPEDLVDVKLLGDSNLSWIKWKKKQPVAGEVWEFRGYELGQFRYVNLGWLEYEIRGGMPPQAPNWGNDSFISDLSGVIVEQSSDETSAQ